MHGSYRPQIVNGYPGWEVQFPECVLDRHLRSTQVLGARRYQYVHHSLDIVVVGLRRMFLRLQGSDVAQEQALRVSLVAAVAAYGDIQQRFDSLEAGGGLA